jgi:hydrogenase maturation protease
MKTVVLGIGNTLLSDEGVGVHVVNAVRPMVANIDGVACIDGGTLSFSLAGDIEDAENLIVIDAAMLDAAPGSMTCMTGARMDRFLGHCKCSAHEVGLIDLLDIARLTTGIPANRAQIAIQPESTDWGEHPGKAVANTIPQAVDKVTELIEAWHVESDR